MSTSLSFICVAFCFSANDVQTESNQKKTEKKKTESPYKLRKKERIRKKRRMGEECAVMEVYKKEEEEDDDDDERSDEFELSLELSIGGGKYGKSENSRSKTRKNNVEGPISNIITNSNFNISSGSVFSSEPVDLQRAKEFHAHEKREGKIKKSREVGCFENNNKNRGIIENDGFLGEENRKKEECGAGGVAINDDLSLSLFTGNKKIVIPSQHIEIIRDCLVYPNVQYPPPLNYGSAYPYPCGVPFWAEEGEGVPNRSLEQSSSAISDYQSTSHKGGTSTDTGSHSSPSRLNQYHSISKKEIDQHFKSNDLSCQTEPDQGLGGLGPAEVTPSSNHHSCWGPFLKKPKAIPTDTHFDQTNDNTCSTSYNLARASGGDVNGQPVKPVHMPCVSTTGNGPNGRTIRGFLYKYSKAEVSIVCVCHGSSFSPAGFVEHAGGVDVSDPLRRITVVRSAFG